MLLENYDYLITLDGLDAFNEMPIPMSEYDEALEETNTCIIESTLNHSKKYG